MRRRLFRYEYLKHATGGAFKELCLKAVLQVQAARPGYGILCNNRIGRRALHAASATGLWIGWPSELRGLRPLALEPERDLDCGELAEWAHENVVKVLCFCRPDDDEQTCQQEEETARRLYQSARRNGLEILLEVIPSKVGW